MVSLRINNRIKMSSRFQEKTSSEKKNKYDKKTSTPIQKQISSKCRKSDIPLDILLMKTSIKYDKKRLNMPQKVPSATGTRKCVASPKQTRKSGFWTSLFTANPEKHVSNKCIRKSLTVFQKNHFCKDHQSLTSINSCVQCNRGCLPLSQQKTPNKNMHIPVKRRSPRFEKSICNSENHVYHVRTRKSIAISQQQTPNELVQNSTAHVQRKSSKCDKAAVSPEKQVFSQCTSKSTISQSQISSETGHISATSEKWESSKCDELVASSEKQSLYHMCTRKSIAICLQKLPEEIHNSAIHVKRKSSKSGQFVPDSEKQSYPRCTRKSTPTSREQMFKEKSQKTATPVKQKSSESNSSVTLSEEQASNQLTRKSIANSQLQQISNKNTPNETTSSNQRLSNYDKSTVCPIKEVYDRRSLKENTTLNIITPVKQRRCSERVKSLTNDKKFASNTHIRKAITSKRRTSRKSKRAHLSIENTPSALFKSIKQRSSEHVKFLNNNNKGCISTKHSQKRTSGKNSCTPLDVLAKTPVVKNTNPIRKTSAGFQKKRAERKKSIADYKKELENIPIDNILKKSRNKKKSPRFGVEDITVSHLFLNAQSPDYKLPGGKNTLKRKREAIAAMKKADEDHEDDIFEDKKFDNFKDLFMDTTPGSIMSFSMATPECGFQVTPVIRSITPKFKDCFSPREFALRRKIAEQCFYRNKKRKCSSKAVTETPRVPEMKRLEFEEVISEACKIQKEIENSSEDESEKDSYFSDL